MSERSTVTIFINGQALEAVPGSIISAVMLNANVPCRMSITGEPRAAMCGMGICFECRATVDGVAHQRTCQLLCREGMRVETQQ